MEMNISCNRIGKTALIAAMTSPSEEADLKSRIDSIAPGMKVAITFVSGMTTDVKRKFIQAVITCSVQNELIRKEKETVHAVMHAALEAFDHICSHIPADASLKMKVAIVTDEKWVAVAIYGDSAIQLLTNHERAALGIMHL